MGGWITVWVRLHEFIACLVTPWLIRRLMMKRIINVENGIVQ
ncbi:hypothetical protein [Enterobacter hormaechei]